MFIGFGNSSFAIIFGNSDSGVYSYFGSDIEISRQQ